MAEFKPDPVPNDFGWTIQWKTNLSNLVKKLGAFLASPEFPSVQTDSLLVDGNAYVTGTVEIEEDLSAQDAAFSGEVNVGEDLTVGGFLRAENSPIRLGPYTASGAEVLVTGIPSWAGKVTVIFSGLSLNGTDNVIIQLGPSSGVETNGYVSGGMSYESTAAGGVDTATAGFIMRLGIASNTLQGTYTFYLVDPATNTWVGEGVQYRAGTARVGSSAGSKSLAGTLERISIMPPGANTLDAGTVAVRCEY